MRFLQVTFDTANVRQKQGAGSHRGRIIESFSKILEKSATAGVDPCDA
jgi:hypothetical protein